MNVTSFKRAVMKQLIKMHKQKGWLRWVPPHPSNNVLALNFSCLPQIEAWHKRVVLRVPLPFSILLIQTYHWSPRAACPFSSSSSSPRWWTDETQGIISGSRWEEGAWAHLERRQEERHWLPSPSAQAPECFPTPHPPLIQAPFNCAPAEGTRAQQKRRDQQDKEERPLSRYVYVHPQAWPRASIKGERRTGWRRFREVWRNRVGSGPRAWGKMNDIEMAVRASLPHANLLLRPNGPHPESKHKSLSTGFSWHCSVGLGFNDGRGEKRWNRARNHLSCFSNRQVDIHKREHPALIIFHFRNDYNTLSNNSYHLLITYYVPDMILSVLFLVTHFSSHNPIHQVWASFQFYRQGHWSTEEGMHSAEMTELPMMGPRDGNPGDLGSTALIRQATLPAYLLPCPPRKALNGLRVIHCMQWFILQSDPPWYLDGLFPSVELEWE